MQNTDDAMLESVNKFCTIFNYTVFVISLFLITLTIFVILKESPREIGTYKWYMLANSCSCFCFEIMIFLAVDTPLSPYKTKAGYMIYMYSYGGIFNYVKLPKVYIYIADEISLFLILILLYSLLSMFIYRYCQTTGHRYLRVLSSRKGLAIHVAIVVVLTLVLVVPINTVSEPDEEEFVNYLKEEHTSLYNFVKNGEFFGVVVRRN